MFHLLFGGMQSIGQVPQQGVRGTAMRPGRTRFGRLLGGANAAGATTPLRVGRQRRFRFNHVALLAIGLSWLTSATANPAAAGVLDCNNLSRFWGPDVGFREIYRSTYVYMSGNNLAISEGVNCSLYHKISQVPLGIQADQGYSEIPLTNPDLPLTAPVDQRKRVLLDVLKGKIKAVPKFEEGDNPPAFQIRTKPGVPGVRGALEDVPVWALATASPDWSIGMLSIPEEFSSLSLLLNVESFGEGDSLGIFFADNLLWRVLLSDFETNTWHAVELDVSEFAGLTAPFTYTLFSEGLGQSRVTLSADLFAYTADELLAISQEIANGPQEVPEPGTLALLGASA